MKKQDSDKVVCSVYETCDYGKFKIITGNRKVDPSRVRRIVNSIEHVGVRMVPIVVNRKMEVIDGQGRLGALKLLGKPVRYVVDDVADVEECRWLNIGCQNWSLRDFIKSYADLGNEDYVVLNSIFEEYVNDIGADTIFTVASGSYTNKDPDRIKSGKFKMKVSAVVAAERLDYLKMFVPKIRDTGGKSREMFSAILFAYDREGVDRSRLYERFSNIDVDKERGLRASILGNLRLLEELYNYRLGSESRIYFAHEWQLWCQE